MWRHEDFWRVLGGGIDFYTGEPLEEYDQSKQAIDPRMVTFPLSPLMHGGAQAGLLMHLFAGHLTILEPKFDPARTWEIIDAREGAADLHDRRRHGPAAHRGVRAQARRAPTTAPACSPSPAAPRSSARRSRSAGWTAFPNAVFTDSVGASETGFQGMGMQDKSNISTDGPVVALGPEQRRARRRQPARSTRPRTSAGSAARPRRLGAGRLLQGPGEVGRRRSSRSTATRYSVPGDFARIEEDGRVTLLGRGSNCVNTGGEKVYPEEVETAIKAPPGRLRRPRRRPPRREVRPGRRRGRPAARRRDAHARGAARLPARHLSGYKLPRALTLVAEVPRNATGKAQYPAAKEIALAQPRSHQL